jgi:hypothetical protein
MDDSDPDSADIYFDGIYWEESGEELVVPPSVSLVHIEQIAASGDLELTYNFNDPESDPDMSEINWYRNGVVETTYENLTTVPYSALVTGDEWNATVTPYDGNDMGIPVDSNTITTIPLDTIWYVYTDADSDLNHYAPTGWMNDIAGIELIENSTVNPYSGDTCIEVNFTSDSWAGVYWQYPNDNWGDSPLGYDLTGAQYLRFWARGEVGGEGVEFKVGGIGGTYPDTVLETTGYVNLTTEWQLYTIDLQSADLSRIAGGFLWVSDVTHNPTGARFYIDDIFFAFPGETPVIITAPEDVTVNAAYSGHTLTWTVTDNHPYTYTIELDGVGIIVSESTWISGGAIKYDIPEKMGVGTHTYTITVYDLEGNVVTDSVDFTVEYTPAPSPTIPGFPIYALLGFTAIAVFIGIRKLKK